MSRALTLAHTHRVALRSDLTERLGLTRTATGLVLRELEDLSLLRTVSAVRVDPGPPTTGRPSHVVEIHPDAPTVLAVLVQATSVLIAEARLGGALGQVDEVPLPQPATPEAVLGLIADLLAARLRAADRRPVGVGLALPSAVGSDGTALAAHHLAWPHALPVRSLLTGLLARAGLGEVRLHVGNDANLAALAESRHGAGRGAAHMLYVMTGQVGVGGGLVIDGRLHLGSAGYALEIGHTPVPPGTRPCRCGNLGCLEVEADTTALLDAAGRSSTEATLDAARAVIARRGVDAAARAAVDLVTRRLAAGIASLINVLNPDRVVLGGMYAELLAAEGEIAPVRHQQAFVPRPGRRDRAARRRARCTRARRGRRTCPAATVGRSPAAGAVARSQRTEDGKKKMWPTMSRTAWRLRPRAHAATRPPHLKEIGMKYLLLKHYRGAPEAVNDVPMDQWTPDEIDDHVRYMEEFAARLEGTGEYVDGQALSPEGTFVRYDGEGRPPVTDGPFAETKDLIAGWMVIDVDTYERAVALAGELSAAPGAGGKPIHEWLELRPFLGAPPTVTE